VLPCAVDLPAFKARIRRGRVSVVLGDEQPGPLDNHHLSSALCLRRSKCRIRPDQFRDETNHGPTPPDGQIADAELAQSARPGHQSPFDRGRNDNAQKLIVRAVSIGSPQSGDLAKNIAC